MSKNVKTKRKKETELRRDVAEPIIYPQFEIEDRENWLVLEGREHKIYSYPDTAVEMFRCPLNSDVEKALQTLGFYDELLKRAGKDSSKNQNRIDSSVEKTTKRNYLGHVNSQEALKLNLALGGETLTLRQSVDLGKDLIDAIEGNRKIRNLKGDYIHQDRLKALFDEMYGKREPWRSEWFDADFKVEGKKLNINYQHKIVNGELKPSRIEQLENCLMENRTPGIDFKDFLRNATYQGLPSANVKEGEFWYWAPMRDNNSVAGLVAGSVRASLSCYGSSSYAVGGLGVRRAKNFGR